MTPAEIDRYVEHLRARGIDAKVVLTTCGPMPELVTPKRADTVRTRKGRNPDPLTGSPSSWAVELVPSCRVYPEANRRDHWAVRRRRFADQSAAVRSVWSGSPAAGAGIGLMAAVTVTLTHVGRTMDTDNLAGAFKGVRDELAALIGVDDGDERVTWKYGQKAGKPGVVIRIEPTPRS